MRLTRPLLTLALASFAAAPFRAAAAESTLASAPAWWHVTPAAGLGAGATIAPLLAGDASRADDPAIDWKILAGLDYTSGKKTDTLARLEGKMVRIPGFVVPLDDFEEEGAEFLLVPYYGACVHTPPPPPNQIVYVKMMSNKKVKLSLFDAVWMHGKLQVASVESPYGTVGFTLGGTQMEPYSSR